MCALCSPKAQLIAQYTSVQTSFVKFYPRVKVDLEITVQVFSNPCNHAFSIIWNSLRWHKRQNNCAIFFCLHIELTEWNNKCNLCKHKHAEAIKLSNHKKRHRKVNYFYVNTICKLCPNIKLPHDILVMSEPTELHHEMTLAGIVTNILPCSTPNFMFLCHKVLWIKLSSPVNGIQMNSWQLSKECWQRWCFWWQWWCMWWKLSWKWWWKYWW